MVTELTLKIDKNVFDRATQYASSHKRSLSLLVETYLKSLILQEHTTAFEDVEISPFVRSISTGVNIPSDLDLKKEYSNFIEEKFK